MVIKGLQRKWKMKRYDDIFEMNVTVDYVYFEKEVTLTKAAVSSL